jgi:predicted amidohydrolase
VLLDRDGKPVGKYRKSHKMPDESMALGDELRALPTDFGPVGLRIGTDRFFPEIDLVYAAGGARLVLWSQMPEPVEDEHVQDVPVHKHLWTTVHARSGGRRLA